MAWLHKFLLGEGRWGWVVPRRGKWRGVILRLMVLAVLLVLGREYLATAYAVGHDWYWRRHVPVGQHCPEDLRRLMHAGRPGEWVLERFGAEYVWAETGDATLLPRMLELAKDGRPRVRAAVVRGLGKFWDARIPETLGRALGDGEPAVRAAAGEAIAELNLPVLAPQLAAALARESDRATREILVRAMRQMAVDLPTTTAAGPRVKVAAIQFRSDFAEPATNRQRLEPLIREAAKAGAKIVVLPETAITGYTSEDFRRVWQVSGKNIEGRFTGIDPRPYAETVPGPSTEAFAKLAGELGIYLTVSLVEFESKTEHYFNTIVLVGPDGKIAAHYRKRNPWPVAESGWATPGDHGLVTLDTEFGRLGLLVCFDINFEPGNLQALGVDTLLYCIAWVDSEKSRWFYVDLPRIAADNNLNIIGANWTVARKTDWAGFGQSLIIDRQGCVLARANRDVGEGIVYAELAVPVHKEK